MQIYRLFLMLILITVYGYSSLRADALRLSRGEEKLDYPLRMLLYDKATFYQMIEQRHRQMLAKTNHSEFGDQFERSSLDSISEVRVLIECQAGADEEVVNQIYNLGGLVNTRLNGLMTAQIPTAIMETVIAIPQIVAVRLGFPLIFACDEMVKATNVIRVWVGNPPLSHSYTGKNVIIGFYDTGIQYCLEDFINPDGTSRIWRIWDQTADQRQNPRGFSYGSEWSREDINDEIDGQPANRIDHWDWSLHGTPSAFIAAGNGRSTDGFLKGIAWESDIVMVANDGGSLYNNIADMIDGINYIFMIADSLNKPCVVNLPWLSCNPSWDGDSPEEKALRQLLAARGGRIICASAGNNGGFFGHFLHVPEEVPHWTYLSQSSHDCLARVVDADIRDIAFQIGLDSAFYVSRSEGYGMERRYYLADRFIPKDSSGWFTVQKLIDAGYHLEDTLYFIQGNGVSTATQAIPIRFDLERNGDFWNLWGRNLVIGGESFSTDSLFARGTFKLMIKKTKSAAVNPIHAWATDISEYLYPFTWARDISNFAQYIEPDNDYHIPYPGCAPEAITVGSYYNKSENAGELASYSNFGPILNSSIKPEITTPGGFVEYCYWSRSLNSIEYGLFGGTSSAVAIASGIAALYLEKYPEADYRQAREAMFRTARRDAFTGDDLPDNRWGYGKIDAFAMLTYDPSPVAEPSVGSDEPFRLLAAGPNPSRGDVRFQCASSRPGMVEIVIYDLLGRRQKELSMAVNDAGQFELRWDGRTKLSNSISTGIYLYQVKWNRHHAHSGKIMIIK